MELQDNLENKAKFFALHWGQRIMKKNIEGLENFITEPDGFLRSPSKETYLELKPLSQISDEDAVEVSKIINKQFPKVYSIGDGEKFIEKYIAGNILALNLSRISTLSHIEHYLRSKGYALPFMGMSVEDQISYGWVKLKGEIKKKL